MDTHYIFKDIPVRNEFGMIATLHTFGRDLKWNPHIHCLIPELIYSFKKDKIKTFHHFNFTKLRKTFQFELIRLIQEAGGLKKPEEKNRLYKDHPKGFYVYAKFKSTDNDSNNNKDIQGCVNFFLVTLEDVSWLKIESQNTIKNQKLPVVSTMIIRMKKDMILQIM